MKRLGLLCMVLALGCARATTPPVSVRASRELAVHRLRTLVVMSVGASPKATDLPNGATQAVSEMLLAAAARESGWRVVDPDRVATALRSMASGGTREERAAAVAKELRADATLTGTVERFKERVGSDYGATEGASVDLDLELVLAGEKAPAWTASYALTQQPLAYNLWNFWQVLRGGPKWLTANELARLGVEEAVSRLAEAQRAAGP